MLEAAPDVDPEVHARRWRILGVALVVGFMSLLDVMIVNVTLPSLRAGLDASASTAQWVVSGYALAFGLTLVAGGRLGDAYGRRRMMALGLTGFILSSAAVGLAPNAVTVVDGRLLVSLGRANAIAVYKLGESALDPVSYVGLIPTDYYPEDMFPVGDQIVVANRRGIDARGPKITFNAGFGTTPATGTARITILPADAPPQLATSPVVAFVHPQEDATLDVFSAVANPTRRVLLLSDVVGHADAGATLSVDGVGYATTGDHLTDIASQLDAYKAAIVGGTITVPSTP